MARTFELAITGDDGAGYRGQCTVLEGASDEVVMLEGTVPLERTFVADALSCRIEAKGRVVVEIRHENGWSRVTSEGGLIDLRAGIEPPPARPAEDDGREANG